MPGVGRMVKRDGNDNEIINRLCVIEKKHRYLFNIYCPVFDSLSKCVSIENCRGTVSAARRYFLFMEGHSSRRSEFSWRAATMVNA